MFMKVPNSGVPQSQTGAYIAQRQSAKRTFTRNRHTFIVILIMIIQTAMYMDKRAYLCATLYEYALI